MNYLKLSFLAVILFFTAHLSKAQVTAGLYTNSIMTYLGVGTDPEKKIFGEARLFAGEFINRFFGAEVIGQYNFIQSDWYNLSGGLMAGYHEFDDARVGLPVLLAIKPIENHRKLALILEATPLYNGLIAFRGNFGLRYTIEGKK
ncbi:hypothetical protein KZP23_07590 [Echinicola marina]|uniref:hypothetical protein n=1 Tax=Echinicola marina TaxID=2859768 RepID=UPI001CF6A9F2|nr:hypothetical protein [Echinicola marina]UCS94863.1 hypothetical protein KZP23_07590 [Echinicola marina]